MAGELRNRFSGANDHSDYRSAYPGVPRGDRRDRDPSSLGGGGSVPGPFVLRCCPGSNG